MRRPLIAGNWKMNLSHAEALALAKAIAEGSKSHLAEREVALFPTHASVASVAAAVGSAGIAVGGQDVSAYTDGAYTGDLSASILASTGATHALVGHSERRSVFGEDLATVRTKLERTLDAGLTPVLCIGETDAEREAGRTTMVVTTQLVAALQGLDQAQLDRIVLAYEPVWAIGTGKTASPEQAQEVHATVRSTLAERFGADFAQNIRILYGGSVKPANVDGLMACPDIDGALVGGASLTADSFLRLVGFEA